MVTPDTAARALLSRAVREQEDLAAAIADLRRKLPQVVCRLRERFGVRRVILFGSLAWGGFHPASDVDLAVDGLAAEDVGEAMAEASAIVGRVVEVFTLESLASGFRARVLAEGEVLP